MKPRPLPCLARLVGLMLLATLLAWPGAAPAAGPAGLRIMVFGDSLTAGLGLPPRQSFVGQLQAALDEAGVAAELVNAGASGDTTATGLARLDWALGDMPDAVILELGANDMLQGIPPATVEANLDAILAKLNARSLPVLLVGMKANRSLGTDYVEAFDALYPALAKKYGVMFYPFFLEGVALDPALNQPDLMHPNARGVAVIVRRVLPDVERLIAEAAGPKSE